MTSKKMVNQTQKHFIMKLPIHLFAVNNKIKDGIIFKKEQTTDKHNASSDVYVPSMLYL